MFEKIKQGISNIRSSIVQQVNGDINNYGLGYNDVKEICRDVFRQEFQIVTKEAVDRLNQIIEEFQERLLEKIAELEDKDLINKFKEPKFQFILHDTIKEFAQTEVVETKEELVDILLDRLQADENSTEKFVIEEATHIIPKLTLAQSRLLGANLMRRMEGKNLPFIFRRTLQEQARLYEHLDEITNLDVAYLHQLKCCEMLPGNIRMATIEEEMRQRYDLFFRESTTMEEYNQYVEAHPILAPGLKGLALICVDADNSDRYKMISLSSEHMKDRLEKEGRMDMWEDLQAYINTLRPYSDKEIMNLLIEIHPNWGKLINLYHQENIQKMSLTPVGMYIANRVVQKEKMRVAKATLKELF